VRTGDPLSVPKADIEERLEKVSGVVAARVSAVCCAGDAAVLYVGIEERDAPHVEFHTPPTTILSLDEALLVTYRDFVAYFGDSARSGDPTGPTAEAYSKNFEHLARDHADSLHRVLRESGDTEQRAMAADILRYGPVTRAAVDDLQYALLDSDRTVRATAMRSLQSLAPRVAAEPDLGIRIELTWFIELLNSLDWYDRDQAATALVGLTEVRDQGALDFMRVRALAALIDMARWKTPAHAHAAFVLVGRIAGLKEKDIQEAWGRGEKERVVKDALKPPR